MRMISQNRGGKGIEERGVKRKMRIRDRQRDIEEGLSDRDTKRQSETETKRYSRKGLEERMRRQRRERTGLY